MTPPAAACWSFPDQKGDAQWAVRVIPNLFPVLTGSASGEVEEDVTGLVRWHARGHHEVVVESPHHSHSWTQHSSQHRTLILQALKERIQAWRRQNDTIQCVQVFKNQGTAAGASLMHPHFQIVALPMVPPVWQRKLLMARHFWHTQAECLYCAMGEAEAKAKERVVETTEDYLVTCPFASRFPYQLHLQPRQHQSDFTLVDEANLESLACVLRRVLQRLSDHVGESVAYNLILHTAPFDGQYPYFHWHWEILPRGPTVAGLEWGTGFYVNSVPPEVACAVLKR